MFRLFKRKKQATAEQLVHAVSIKQGSVEELIKALQNQSVIVLIAGKRGSGKTALGFTLLELAKGKKQCYVVGIKARLPRWIKQTDSIERIKNNSVVLIDEAAISLSARQTSNAFNKAISKLMVIARHKQLSLIFISQNTAMLDINVLRLIDAFIIKQPSLLQERFERKEIKDIIENAKQEFAAIANKENNKAYAYVVSDWFEGMIKTALPSFWNEKLSKSFAFFEIKI